MEVVIVIAITAWFITSWYLVSIKRQLRQNDRALHSVRRSLIQLTQHTLDNREAVRALLSDAVANENRMIAVPLSTIVRAVENRLAKENQVSVKPLPEPDDEYVLESPIGRQPISEILENLDYASDDFVWCARHSISNCEEEICRTPRPKPPPRNPNLISPSGR